MLRARSPVLVVVWVPTRSTLSRRRLVLPGHSRWCWARHWRGELRGLRVQAVFLRGPGPDGALAIAVAVMVVVGVGTLVVGAAVMWEVLRWWVWTKRMMVLLPGVSICRRATAS